MLYEQGNVGWLSRETIPRNRSPKVTGWVGKMQMLRPLGSFSCGPWCLQAPQEWSGGWGGGERGWKLGLPQPRPVPLRRNPQGPSLMLRLAGFASIAPLKKYKGALLEI